MMKKADKIRGWSICESCLNNAGGCSWTEEDPATHRIRFEPVPGWTAQPTTIPWSRKRVESYFVTACAPDGDRLTVLGRHWRFAPGIGTQPCMQCPRIFFCGEWTGCEQFKAWAEGQKSEWPIRAKGEQNNEQDEN